VPHHEVERPAHGGPQLRQERLVAGREEVVPQADGDVRGVVGLCRRPYWLSIAVQGRPGAVRPLFGAQPPVRGPGPCVPAADVERHRGLDVVPRIELAARKPGNRAGALLHGGDAVHSGLDGAGVEDAG
jgi:hypothetical protein